MKLGLRGRILCATGAAVLCALLAMGAAVWFAVPANERLELLWPLLSIGSVVVVVVTAPHGSSPGTSSMRAAGTTEPVTVGGWSASR